MKILRTPTTMLWAVCTWLCSTGAWANDFPTLERVLYVQECMHVHPGPQFEMSSKCACVLDTLAQEVRYDDYVTLSTVSKASTIAGERGGQIRDAATTAPQVKRFRELQVNAEKSCFIGASAR